jgi:hypothetical protein
MTMTHDITDTNFTQWTDNTNCQPTVHVVYRFTDGLSGLRQTQPPRTNKDPCPLSISISRQGRQAPPTNQLLTDTGLCIAREFHAVRVPPRTKKQD